jgi:hypothetical protein
MAAKDALKHWLTLIDQALLKEEKRRLPNHTPVPAASGDTSMTRPEAGSPPNTPATLLAGDVHIDETDTTTLRNALQSLRGHASMPINTYMDI